MRKVKKVVLPLIGLLLVLPVLVQAQPPAVPAAGTLVSEGEVWTLVTNLLRWVFWIAVAVAFAFIVMGLIGWATSGGDDEKMKKARWRLFYGVIGVALIFGVSALIALVANVVFGVTISWTELFGA